MIHIKSKRCNGFTLVEALFVIAISSMALVYFSRLYIEDSERKVWDIQINQLMVLQQAIISSYYERDGLWPGQVDSSSTDCSSLPSVKSHLDNYIPLFGYKVSEEATDPLYTFDCTEPQFFKVKTVEVASSEVASYIATRLPAAKVEDAQVLLMIVKPRLPYASAMQAVEGTTSGGTVSFLFPSGCDAEKSQLDVTPMNLCAPSGETLGGYLTNITKNETSWIVEVRTRNDQDSGGFELVSGSCEALVKGFRFCQL